MKDKVRVGLVGSGFICAIHADALKRCADAQVVAVMSPTKRKAEAFAQRQGIAHHFTDYDKFLQLDGLDLVVIGAPNDVHCDLTVRAAAAGKHIILEKPMCLNMAQADQMIDACRKAKVKLMYAEELCFAPKYV